CAATIARAGPPASARPTAAAPTAPPALAGGGNGPSPSVVRRPPDIAADLFRGADCPTNGLASHRAEISADEKRGPDRAASRGHGSAPQLAANVLRTSEGHHDGVPYEVQHAHGNEIAAAERPLDGGLHTARVGTAAGMPDPSGGSLCLARHQQASIRRHAPASETRGFLRSIRGGRYDSATTPQQVGVPPDIRAPTVTETSPRT